MLYSEFRNTYKATIKKFPDITALFREEPEKVITCRTIRQIKTGSRWTTTEEITDKINFIHYTNILDGIPFFRNLGGSENVNITGRTNICGLFDGSLYNKPFTIPSGVTNCQNLFANNPVYNYDTTIPSGVVKGYRCR